MKHLFFVCLSTVSFLSYSSENHSKVVAEAYRVAECLKAFKNGDPLDLIMCIEVDRRYDQLLKMPMNAEHEKKGLEVIQQAMREEGLEAKFLALVYNDPKKICAIR
jgi:hypothetical protein